MPKLRLSQIISLLLISLVFLVQPAPDVIHQLILRVNAKENNQTELPHLIRPIIIPVFTGDALADQLPNTFTASAIYVMDRQSGAILYQKNADEPHYPASTEKMMTALVARREYPLTKVFMVGEEAFSTGSTMGLKIGEHMTVEQLLYGLLIPSGNDAAFVLANNHPGKYVGFVTEMNNMAKELHLTHTRFQNPSGLDANNQSSTARDLAIVANEVMKDPFLRKIVSTKSTTIHDVTGTYQHPLTSTNELLGVVDGVVGIKTGTTDFAGENLITAVDRNGHEVIAVVLGSKDRYAETVSLINWIFQNYEWQTVK